MTDLVLRFEELRAADVERVGGKCANLGELTGAGFPVPAGFGGGSYVRGMSPKCRRRVGGVSQTRRQVSLVPSLWMTYAQVRALI